MQQPVKTKQMKQSSAIRLVLLMLLLSSCSIMFAATDSSFVNEVNKRPNFFANSNCVNAELSIAAISPKVERIVWKHNNQVVHTSTTPSLIRTVAGTVEGTNDDQLRFPSAIVADKEGNVYVADQFNHRIQKWIAGASEGVTVAGGRGQGDAADQLDYPMGIAFDANGNMYVADAANHRIQKFAPGSRDGITVAGGNGRGKAANQLSMPFGICLDAAGNIYVADNYNHRVQLWAPGATTGITVAGGNGKGKAANQLQYPSSVKIDAAGTIYIADAANDRVQAWKKGASSGITVAGGKGRGTAADQLYFPTDIAINSKGELFIADETNQRIQRWSKGAKAGITVAGGNGLGNNADQFSYPYGLFVDQADNIYVADQYNHRIQFFQNPESPISYQFTFKATRPGTYQADVVYRNGAVQTTDPIEVYDAPTIKPIIADVTVCSGKEYAFSAEVSGGSWSSSNTSIAMIDEKGVFKALQGGKTIVTYQLKNEFGCESVIRKEIDVKAPPTVPPVTVAPQLIQQSTTANGNSLQLCAGSSIALGNMSGNGNWISSDTSVAVVVNGQLKGFQEGTATIRYMVEQNGCSAFSEATFTVAPMPQPRIIHGLNKVATGNTVQLNAGAVTGQWSSANTTIAEVDARGYVKGLQPGVTAVVFAHNNEQGCTVRSTIPLTVQPMAPVVKDAVYETKEHAARILITAQVIAKQHATLQFFETALPNAKSIDPVITNTPGVYTIWVAQIENGIASQRVPFTVKITNNVYDQKGKGLNPIIMGNPATNFFTVKLQSEQTQLPITMRVVDLQGRLIEQRSTITANATIQFGQQYMSGQYIVEWMQGAERKVVQLLKLGSGGQQAAGYKPQVSSLK